MNSGSFGKRILFVVLSVLVLAILSAPSPRIFAGSPDQSGEPGPTAVGVRVDPHQLPAIPRGDTPQEVREIPRLHPVDEATFGQMKATANAAARRANSGAGKISGPAPRFDAISLTGWNPPDGGLAVGVNSVLLAVNESFALYDKSGNLLFGLMTFNTLFGQSGSIFDPRAIYDAAAGHFILLTATMNTSARTASFDLAVSQSDSASTTWCTFNLNAVTGSGGTLAWSDFPGLGMDANYLYITSNQFSFGRNSFQYARILAVPKTSVYPSASGCPTATSANFPSLKNPNGSLAFTVQPANQPDATSGSTNPMYFVNAIWSSGSRLAVRSMSNLSLAGPSWVNTAACYLPANALQPNGNTINTDDDRLLGAIYRFGNIYTANTTGAGSGSLSINPYASGQWYVFAPTATTASSSVVTDSNSAYYYPGVVPACIDSTCASKYVGIEVSGSSSTIPASAFAFRNGGTPTIYAQGVAGYTLNVRWGDYPGVSTDPSDVTKTWVLSEYAKTTGGWGTAVVSP